MLHNIEQLKTKCAAVSREIETLMELAGKYELPALVEHRLASLDQLWKELNHDVHLDDLIEFTRNAGC